MGDPEANHDYTLVRWEDGRLLAAKFLRYEDGSGRVIADGWHTSFELDQTTWRRKWVELLSKGYVELSEALRLGTISLEEHDNVDA